MAAGGYPNSYNKGEVISGLAGTESKDLKIFHAGTVKSKGKVVTNGGRILCAVALGETVSKAQARAYNSSTRCHGKPFIFAKTLPIGL